MRSGPRPPARALVLALASTLAMWARPTAAASFFGESHLEVPVATALTDIDLQLRFSTAQPEALLLLAAGQADHLLLQLHSGRLQVRLTLGQEELRLQTPAEPLLSDSEPHTVVLAVSDHWATLSVDGHLNTSAPMPGAPLEAPYGLFVGGAGSLGLPYLLGASRPLRGCLLEATLNGRSLLRPLTPDVPEGCAEELLAGADVALGFPGPGSLATFPAWSTQDRGSLAFTLTTRSRHAPLAFQAGGQPGEFIYVDVFEGHLRAVVERSQGTMLLHNSVPVADGQPHEVSVHLDSQRLEISVDQYPTRTSNRGMLSSLEPRGGLLLGGLDAEASRHLREHRLGLAPGPADASLLGCLEDLSINGQRYGLREALLTRSMAAGCRLDEEDEYEEDAYGPYEALSTLAPEAWPAAQLPEPCAPEPGLPPVFANFTQLLTVSPLVVAEGGTAWLEWRHLQPTLDLTQAELRRSQVLFSVSRGPRHGELQLDVPGARARKMFTLLDVVNRKARFVHDGSEAPADQLVLEVSVTARAPVPSCLRRGQTYVLPVRVDPVNDPPRVVFPHGDRMVLLEHTQKPLGPDVVQAYDPDSACDGLTFQLLGAPAGGLPVERRDAPGQPAAEFSCRELEAGGVVYVHRGGPTQDLTLRVSDGLQAGPPATLRVVAVRPVIRVRHSTGLHLAQGSAAPLLPANLSVDTNAVGQDVSVLFRVTGALRLGEVQRRGAGGLEGTEWRAARAFHQHDVEQGRVRYLSTDPRRHDADTNEDLALEVQVGQETLSNLSFPVTVQPARVWMRRLEPLHTRNAQPEALTEAHLEAALDEEGPAAAAFHYELVQAPRKGNLQLQGARLSDGQGFSQDDLRAGRVTYEAAARASEAAEDSFRFRVTAAPHASPVYTFPIHIGGDPDAPVLTNVLLPVAEGGEAVLSADHLFVRSLQGAGYLFEVVERPRHGRLAWRGAVGADADVTAFTNEDLLRGRLVYQHDGSETTEDDVPFVATRQGEGSGAGSAGWEEVRGVLRVAVQPVNDHAPVQTVSRVFHVARGGQRLLTTDDVAFSDADSGFSDAQLVLTRKDLLFGSIVAAAEPSRPIYRFTQEDLRRGRVLFLHSGADHGWLQLQVSDGQHQATALLEVQASEPYLRLANGSGLLVPQGGQATVDTAALRLDTNLDIRSGDEVHYVLTAGPRWGQLLRVGLPTGAFSQQDVLDGVLVYRHNGSLSPRDALTFSVEAGSVQVEATLPVTVALESPPPPLRLVRHKKIYVFQGEAAEIPRDRLAAAQEAVAPADIMFLVKSPPLAGYLVEVSPGSPPSLDPVQNFSQEAVDAGRVLYLHSRPEAWQDAFSLDVASGLGALLEGIRVELEVLPKAIPLEAQNFSVAEGGAQALAPPLLRITGPYFPSVPSLLLQVLVPPRHGTLQREDGPQGGPLGAFSWREVEERQIRYVHDGSETPTDSFVLVANASEMGRQSHPVTVTVTVLPVNDQPPVLTANMGLQMWEGATVPIPAEALRGTDGDSAPQDLVYTIEQPSNGRVALRAAPGAEVHSFSQAQLDTGLVLFTHTGALDGGFRFALSDGQHISPGHFFRVTAQKRALLSLDGSRTVTVCPGSVQPLSSRNLKASSSTRADPHALLFEVLAGPKLGRLLHSRQGGAGDALVNFTQAEVYAGEVLYEHEMPPEPFWEAHDALELRLSSPPAPDVAATLAVTVSFAAACPQRTSRLWKNEGLWVPEGQQARITVAALDASNFLASIPSAQRPEHDVLFQVTQFPTRGQLLLSEEPLHAGQPHFLQSQLAAGQLLYAHGGSGMQQDSFRFRAHLQGPAGAPVAGPHTSEAFPITVRDVNERPPQPQASVPLRLTRGSRAPISRAQLSVVDPDSAPGEVEYQVQRAPRNGFLSLAGGGPGPVTRFSQADVDAGRLAFVANGSSVVGVFQLSVSDGASPPLPVSLSVDVLPSTMEVQLRAPLEVPQALGRSALSRQQLQAVSDREEPDAAYSLTQAPRHGHLLVAGQPASAFSQRQVDQGDVVFAFTNFSSPHDHFAVLAQARGVNASAMVNVTVRALLRVGAVGPWPQGATLRLDPAVLDASELANRTGSVPRFRLLEGPRHGRVVRVAQARTEPVEQFTQQDLQDGRLGLEIARSPGPAGDSLTLELWAPGVPPAVASLDFATEPYDAARSYRAFLLRVPEAARTEAGEPGRGPPTGQPGPAASSPVPAVARGGFLGFVQDNMFSIIVPLCLVLLLLALILPLLFYLRKRNKTGKHDVQVLAAKPRNGLAGDTETFRKVEPGQAIPLMAVPGQGPPPGGQADPELLQFCRTPNPALKNGQYWV